MTSDQTFSPRIPPIIVHVPHASPIVPQEDRDRMDIDEASLAADIESLTDWYTDELFDVSPVQGETIRFSVSRFVVDPERYEDDDLEPMAARGMGVIYQKLSDGTVFRPTVPSAERERLLETYYRPHHATLERAVERSLSAHGSCLILDIHSFPDKPLPVHVEQYGDRPIPDICIGTQAGHTPPWLIAVFERHARAAGLMIDIDHPFAGSIVPGRWPGDPRVLSVMIEFNKRLYLEPGTSRRTEGFRSMQRWSQSLFGELQDSLVANPI